jgi:hypothetical protein
MTLLEIYDCSKFDFHLFYFVIFIDDFFQSVTN